MIGLARKPLGRCTELHLKAFDEQIALAQLGLRGDQHSLQDVDIVGEKIGVE